MDTSTKSVNGPLFASFAQAEAKTISPKALRDHIRTGLRDEKVWASVQPYLTPPGVCGAQSFDHANVVRDLLAWDSAENGGALAAFKQPQRVLWNHIYVVLGSVYATNNGRVIGLRENSKLTTTEQGADIE